jgi:hypothetical protein
VTISVVLSPSAVKIHESKAFANPYSFDSSEEQSMCTYPTVYITWDAKNETNARIHPGNSLEITLHALLGSDSDTRPLKENDQGLQGASNKTRRTTHQISRISSSHCNIMKLGAQKSSRNKMNEMLFPSKKYKPNEIVLADDNESTHVCARI